MSKLIKFTLPLFLLLYSNVEIANSKIINSYSQSNYNQYDQIDASVEFINPNLTFYNTNTPTAEEIDEFWECIDSNTRFKSYALMLATSSLNTQINNIKAVNFKYIPELPDINSWSLFSAMNNALQKAINSFGGGKTKSLKIKPLFNTNYSNAMLDAIADIYLRSYSYTKNSSYSGKFEQKLSFDSLLYVKTIFEKLKFDKIFETVIKGTLKIKELLQTVEKDKKPLQLSNKLLTDSYDKVLDENTGYFLKLENYDIGICWLDASFELIYTSVLNSNSKDIKNTNFYKFIKFLEQKQKNRAIEVKKKNGIEVISQTKKERNRIKTIESTTKITDQISILEALDEFISQMKKEDLEAWNKEDNVKKAKEKINELIKENKETKKQKKEHLIKELQNKLNNNSYANKQNIELEQPSQSNNNRGGNSIQGINLFINLFPELKKLFIPQLELIKNNNKEDTNKDKNNDNNNQIDDNITCGDLINNEISSFDNIFSVDPSKKVVHSINSSTNYKIITSANYKEEIPLSKHDTLTVSNYKKMTSLPEYMILNGWNFEGNDSGIRIQGMKFDETLNKYIVGFDEKSELAIYEVSSMVMGKNTQKHAYSLYKGGSDWYIMDDHNKYYKLKPEEFKEIIEKDKVSTFVYKKLYCGKIEKDTKKEEDKTKVNPIKDNKLPN